MATGITLSRLPAETRHIILLRIIRPKSWPCDCKNETKLGPFDYCSHIIEIVRKVDDASRVLSAVNRTFHNEIPSVMYDYYTLLLKDSERVQDKLHESLVAWAMTYDPSKGPPIHGVAAGHDVRYPTIARLQREWTYLERVIQYMQTTVQKLWPDRHLPGFDTSRLRYFAIKHAIIGAATGHKLDDGMPLELLIGTPWESVSQAQMYAFLDSCANNARARSAS